VLTLAEKTWDDYRDARAYGVIKFLVRGVRQLGRFQASRDLRAEKNGSFLEISRFFRFSPIRSVKLVWGFTLRALFIVESLALLLVLWELRSVEVDPYALWALLPAWILLCSCKTSPGKMLFEGSAAFLSCLVGGSIGIFSASFTHEVKSAYISQFVLVLFVSALVTFRQKRAGGVYLLVSWMVATQGAWRTALAREVIMCAGIVFCMASVILLFPRSASDRIANIEAEVDAQVLDLVQWTVKRASEDPRGSLISSPLGSASSAENSIDSVTTGKSASRLEVALALRKRRKLFEERSLECRRRRNKIKASECGNACQELADLAGAVQVAAGENPSAPELLLKAKEAVFVGGRAEILEFSRLLAQTRIAVNSIEDFGAAKREIALVGSLGVLLEFARAKGRQTVQEIV
jgi:hypothetical protein